MDQDTPRCSWSNRNLFKELFWLFPEYVGTGVATEIGETFYKGHHFSMRQHHLLKPFLADKSLTGVAPITFIRSLSVDINDYELQKEDKKCGKLSESSPTLSHLARTSIRRCITALLSVKQDFPRTLTNSICGDMSDARLERIFEIIQPFSAELKTTFYESTMVVLADFEYLELFYELDPLLGLHRSLWRREIMNFREEKGFYPLYRNFLVGLPLQ